MYQISFDNPISVYFIGIGGISMSGLALVLADRGFKVTGSDRSESDATAELVKAGIRVHFGQKAENIDPANKPDLVVYTAAVHPDNPEFAAAKELGIPMLTRAELLGQIMQHYYLPVNVAGTHGKTTTTAMVSKIMIEGKLDPTVSIGGFLKDIDGNIRIGASKYFVTEACEYTNSFLSFFPGVGIILNIDADHLDFFKDLDDIRRSFRKFAELIPENGTLVINGEIPNLSEITDGLSCNIKTYGFSDEFDYYPTDISYDAFGNASFHINRRNGNGFDISLKVPGKHNIGNAVAAAATADVFEVPDAEIAAGLSSFTGTGRRFEYRGTVDGLTIIDDYAHHPTEIAATLSAAKNYPHKTLWVVFQPHTFTRTKALMDEFANALLPADKLIIADIYAARETDNLGISSRTLKEKIESLGHECYYFPSFDEIEKFLLQNCTKDDMLITMGAGDIVNIANDLLGR
ncbi:UDP-N-acetylmuramate--L-alanine ligase [Butyrivibrio sp. XPD2002]|uniref:UDP-N-acetylmuramate--L-alanine ligase n=1 Tax=Butyrivibrio sp. XPD2002 TaxID=1280665 RepID=UPI00040AD96B|nr:UDP-N-acetylmuramate--L-alanine ligase [Butyrivibrio sp. XPD2002]